MKWTCAPAACGVSVIHGPDGKDYPNEIIFSEVIKPERLVYTHRRANVSSLR